MSNKNYESHRKAIVSKGIPPALLNRLTNSDVQVINTFANWNYLNKRKTGS